MEKHRQMGEKSAKFVSFSPIILTIWYSSSPRRIDTSLVVLREGNRKSLRTAAHLCKSIKESARFFFGMKRFITLKWLTKFEVATETLKTQ